MDAGVDAELLACDGCEDGSGAEARDGVELFPERWSQARCGGSEVRD